MLKPLKNSMCSETKIMVGDTYTKNDLSGRKYSEREDGRVRITGVSPSGKICEYLVCATNEIFICATTDITEEYIKDTV